MHLLLICTSLLFTCLVQAEEPPALNAGQAFRQQLQGQAKLLISEHYGDLLARWPTLASQLEALVTERRVRLGNVSINSVLSGKRSIPLSDLEAPYRELDAKLVELLGDRYAEFATYEEEIDDRAVVRRLRAAAEAENCAFKPAVLDELLAVLGKSRQAAELVFRWDEPLRMSPTRGLKKAEFRSRTEAMYEDILQQASALLDEAQLKLLAAELPRKDRR